MSQLQKVLKELQEVAQQVMILVEYESWNTLEDLLNMICLFGEAIGSNGIRTASDVDKLQTLKSENPILFTNVLYDNLQLLIIEYEQLVIFEKKSNLVSPFNYEESPMALIKQEIGKHEFIYETDTVIQSVLENIPSGTEAVILVGHGSGSLRAKLADFYHVLTIDPYTLMYKANDDSLMSFPMYIDKELLQNKLQSFVGLKTEVIAHPLYPYSENLVELLKTVRNFLQEIQIELVTSILYSEKWYKETLVNANYLTQHTDRIMNIDHLKDQYKGNDALMIAGGPSLEEALPYLQQVQHAHYIVAIGQTVKVLLNHHIIPDFIISIDAGEANAHFFNNFKIDVPLVYSLQVNHQIPQQTKSLLIPYADLPMTQDLLKYSKISFSTFPTVALSAVAFANYLGFDSIGLIGQDLALREGEYYSPSVKTVSSNDGQFSDKLYDVPLNNGRMGKTTPVLSNFLSGYQSLIKSFPELATKLVNYAEHGALIDSVPYQSLETLKTTKIMKRKLKVTETVSSIEIPVDDVLQILGSISEHLSLMHKRLNRVVKQKAVTIDEFERMLRDWDTMIEAPSYRTHIMPLQLVNLLTIQNKINLHNRYRRTSEMRLVILSRMQNAIQELQIQLKKLGANSLKTTSE